jgi:hypothetical protein
MRGERDPERPDPAEPSRERVRETLIERQIRAAMDEGAFDGLPHLRNAGVAPPWIEADKAVRDRLLEIERLHERVATMSPLRRWRARTELEAMVEAANRAIARVNAEAPTDRQHRRFLDLSVELERFDRGAEASRDKGSAGP